MIKQTDIENDVKEKYKKIVMQRIHRRCKDKISLKAGFEVF